MRRLSRSECAEILFEAGEDRAGPAVTVAGHFSAGGVVDLLRRYVQAVAALGKVAGHARRLANQLSLALRERSEMALLYSKKSTEFGHLRAELDRASPSRRSEIRLREENRLLTVKLVDMIHAQRAELAARDDAHEALKEAYDASTELLDEYRRIEVVAPKVPRLGS